MVTARSRRVAFAELVACAGFVAAAVLVLATPAFAHNFYVSSTPSENEVLTTLPDEFTVTTNDDLLDLGGGSRGFIMQVVGPDGMYFGDGCVTVHGPAVSTAVATLGNPGDYKLRWQVISADGHTVAGAVPFSWQPTGKSVVSTGAANPPQCGTDAVTPNSSEPTDASSAASADSMTDALWIGGAVLAVAIAVVVTLMLLRPRSEPSDPPESPVE